MSRLEGKLDISGQIRQMVGMQLIEVGNELEELGRQLTNGQNCSVNERTDTVAAKVGIDDRENGVSSSDASERRDEPWLRLMPGVPKLGDINKNDLKTFSRPELVVAILKQEGKPMTYSEIRNKFKALGVAHPQLSSTNNYLVNRYKVATHTPGGIIVLKGMKIELKDVVKGMLRLEKAQRTTARARYIQSHPGAKQALDTLLEEEESTSGN